MVDTFIRHRCFISQNMPVGALVLLVHIKLDSYTFLILWHSSQTKLPTHFCSTQLYQRQT